MSMNGCVGNTFFKVIRKQNDCKKQEVINELKGSVKLNYMLTFVEEFRDNTNTHNAREEQADAVENVVRHSYQHPERDVLATMYKKTIDLGLVRISKPTL